MPSSATSDRLRVRLLLILALAVFGTLAELLLLEHYEGWRQWLPLGGLLLAAASGAWFALARSTAARAAFQSVMCALVLLGVAGVILHWRGNLEFEREISPELASWALWREVASGATPVLAPGSLIPFGLLGLLVARMFPLHSSEDS
jgi:hypothetical protein